MRISKNSSLATLLIDIQSVFLKEEAFGCLFERKLFLKNLDMISCFIDVIKADDIENYSAEFTVDCDLPITEEENENYLSIILVDNKTKYSFGILLYGDGDCLFITDTAGKSKHNYYDYYHNKVKMMNSSGIISHLKKLQLQQP